MVRSPGDRVGSMHRSEHLKQDGRKLTPASRADQPTVASEWLVLCAAPHPSPVCSPPRGHRCRSGPMSRKKYVASLTHLEGMSFPSNPWCAPSAEVAIGQRCRLARLQPRRWRERSKSPSQPDRWPPSTAAARGWLNGSSIGRRRAGSLPRDRWTSLLRKKNLSSFEKKVKKRRTVAFRLKKLIST